MPMPFQSRLTVAVNGQPVDGLLGAELSTNNCFSADTFSLIFAAASSGILFWSSLSEAYIEIRDEVMAAEIMTGMADLISIDPLRKVVSIEGRDLSASLIDTYRQQDFVNQTAAEIVAMIAFQHELEAQVSPTAAWVGRYYDESYTRLSLGQFSKFRSDWDVVVHLARENGYDAFVSGRRLVFQPSGVGSQPYALRRNDVRAIRLERRPQLAAQPEVRLQSWNVKDMTAHSYGPASQPAASPYLFSQPNLTADQVEQLCGRYGDEVGRFGISLFLDMPWDLDLTPQRLIALSQTETVLDGLYRIESIDRHFSTVTGSFQHVRGSYISA